MDKIKDGIKKWIHLNILLLLLMFVTRIVFFIETTTRIDIDTSQFLNVILGFKYDLLLVSHFIIWDFLVFLLLYWFIPKTTVKIYKVLIFIFALISTLLTEYFCNLMMPLDHVIFAYSVESLKATISSSASFSIIPILYIVISMTLFVIISRLWEKVRIPNILTYIILIVAAIMSVSFDYGKIIRDELYSDNHADFIIATNQPAYSFIKIFDYLEKDNAEENVGYEIIEEAAKSYQQLNARFTYPDINYPFYRKSDYQDVIGKFLNKTENGEKPNFVFIIVESLGQCLTGVENPSVSFTPFIDSLKNEGLYWQNCIATTERTFGVLPAIFASTPHGKSGFARPYTPIPSHNSLLKDFKKNNYDISYYYSCYRNVDRYDNFLRINDIENIFIPEHGVVDEETLNLMQENNRWGLDDKELFEIVINNRKSSDNEKPFVDIIMTLSTHEPFVIMEDFERYKLKTKEIVEESNIVNSKEENNILKNVDVFACYLYMDECVKNLIEDYKSLPEYENTIFIITGDHRTGMLNTGNILRSFNVPLLIYSPLIKNDRQMKAVVSHYDITPTINAYLSNNYDYQVDEYCHWLGTSLDTVREFRSKRKQAFMLNNRDVVDYLHDEYFLCRKKLYKIDEDLSLEKIDDPLLYEKLRKELDDYNLIGVYALESNFLNCESNAEFLDIAEYHFDFDNITNKIFDKLILDSLDNKFAYFDEKLEFIYLYPYWNIDDDYMNFSVNISFDLKTYTENNLPLLVITIDDFYQAIPLVSLKNESLNTGDLEHFVKKINISKGKSYKGKDLKIYLWNRYKDRMMFDNVDILIKASK